MRQEYLDVLSKGYSIEICVDYNASGRSVDEDEISPDSITYYIRDGELRTWNDDEVITEFECIDDIDEMSDEEKKRIIRECIKTVYVEADGKTIHGKIIEIIMIDGVKYKIHMTKKGNNFITNIILNNEEKPLDDFQITARFIRKKKS